MPALLRALNGTNRSHVLKTYHIDTVRQFCYEHRGELVNPRIYSYWAIRNKAARLVGVQLVHIFLKLKLQVKTNPDWIAPRMFLAPGDFKEPAAEKKNKRAGAWSQAAKEKWKRRKEKTLDIAQ